MMCKGVKEALCAEPVKWAFVGTVLPGFQMQCILIIKWPLCK